MWDPDQRAEIPVLIDRLQAKGDPLGEWLALHLHLDTGEVARAQRKILRRRLRALRASPALAQDPRMGRLHVIRELGLIADASFAAATAEGLAWLLDRVDAPFVLRLHLRGELEALRGCVELLRGADGAARTRASLRELGLELVDGAGEVDHDGALALRGELEAQREALGVELPSLFALTIDRAPLGLPFDRAGLDRAGDWSPSRRVALGRALASPEPELRRRALERLRAHAELAAQLRAPLVAIIEDDPSPDVRAAAFAVVPGLGALGHTIRVLAAQLARERDDPQLREWLAVGAPDSEPGRF